MNIIIHNPKGKIYTDQFKYIRAVERWPVEFVQLKQYNKIKNALGRHALFLTTKRSVCMSGSSTVLGNTKETKDGRETSLFFSLV